MRRSAQSRADVYRLNAATISRLVGGGAGLPMAQIDWGLLDVSFVRWKQPCQPCPMGHAGGHSRKPPPHRFSGHRTGQAWALPSFQSCNVTIRGAGVPRMAGCGAWAGARRGATPHGQPRLTGQLDFRGQDAAPGGLCPLSEPLQRGGCGQRGPPPGPPAAQLDPACVPRSLGSVAHG